MSYWSVLPQDSIENFEGGLARDQRLIPQEDHCVWSPYTKFKFCRRRRLPAIIVLIIDLFAFGILICVALTVPILWTALTNVQPRTPDQHCAAVKDNGARLACYDRVLRENSPRVKDKND
jgi:hypothetical protein